MFSYRFKAKSHHLSHNTIWRLQKSKIKVCPFGKKYNVIFSMYVTLQKSRHLDQAYYEPRGEYILESDEEHMPSFRAKPPKQLETCGKSIIL